MADHDVTLVRRRTTANLINADGTIVRIGLKGEQTPHAIPSAALPGRAERLINPSSAARAIAAGAPLAERVDLLVQRIGRQQGISHPAIDNTVALVDFKIAQNRRRAA